MRSAAWLVAALPSLFGLAPCGVYPAPALTSRAVRSYRTISPLPRRWSSRNGEPSRQAGPTRVLRFQGGPRPGSRGVAEAVSFLWHWPSMGLEAHVPDVIRHTALRSSDFPPPASPACARPPAATARSSCQYASLPRKPYPDEPNLQACRLATIEDDDDSVPLSRAGGLRRGAAAAGGDGGVARRRGASKTCCCCWSIRRC